MSLLINQNWIGLDGTPVTGRVPPQIIMMAGVLTPQRHAQVAHAYQMFCLGKLTAITDYFVANRTLADGTRVRCESMQGKDRVFVWAADSGDEKKIPQGFNFKWGQRGDWLMGIESRYLWEKCTTAPLPASYTAFKEGGFYGYQTWASKKMLLRGKPLQLSWGQPPNFYELSPSKQLCAGLVPITRVKPNNADATGWVVAACLVRAASGVILRTCERGADGYQFVDYGAPGDTVAPFSSLRDLIDTGAAKEFRRSAILAGYTEGPITTAEQWRFLTRPCFNESGTSAVFVVAALGEQIRTSSATGTAVFTEAGPAVAVADAETAQLSRTYPELEQGETTVTVTTVTSGFEGDPVSETSAGQTTVVKRKLLAVDYLGDTVVWAWKEIRRVAVSNSSQSSGGGGGYRSSSSRSIEYTLSAGHSQYGTLISMQHTVSESSAVTGNLGVVTGTASRSGGNKHLEISFGGNLASDGFCFGWCEEELVPAPTLTPVGGEQYDQYVTFTGVDTPISRARMRYDVFIAGRRVASDIKGRPVFDDAGGLPRSRFYRTTVGGDVFLRNAGGRSRTVLDTTNDTSGTDVSTYSLTSNVSRGSTLADWPIATLAGLLQDISRGNIDANGFYSTSETPLECVVSPLRDAVYVTDGGGTYGWNIGSDGPQTHPGLCHFIRKDGDTYEKLWMAYGGPLPAPYSGQYLIAPEHGIFVLGPEPTSTP